MRKTVVALGLVGAAILTRLLGGLLFAVDPFGSYIVAVASASTGIGQQILRINIPGGSYTTVRTGLSGVGGIATDGSYAYWTDSTGRVFKASVF